MTGLGSAVRVRDRDLTRTPWLDGVRGVAMLWVFLVHVAEEIFGSPFFMNPAAGWPPLSERFSQLAPVAGLGSWSIPANLLRWVGWLGDQGVQLFLIVTGYLLVVAGRRAMEDGSLIRLWWQRLRRFLPMWWVAFLTFALASLLLGRDEPNPFSLSFVLSLLGIRVRPEDLYYGAGSWWYIGLLVQLGLIAPFLVRLARRSDGFRILGYLLGASVFVRGAGLLILEGHPYLDAWSRGAIVVTRLPEVLFGMMLALWIQRSPRAEELVTSGRVLAGAGAAWLTGTLLGFTLLGNALTPLLTGAGLVLVLRWLFRSKVPSWLGWIGVHSLSLFIVHHPIVDNLVPGLGRSWFLIAATIAAAVVVSVVAALALEKATSYVIRRWTETTRRRGIPRVLVGLGLAVGLVAGLVVGAEVWSRRLVPQEINGWGERPALDPHPEFGWTYKPNTAIPLAWLSYDYTIEVNEEGFPGPVPEAASGERLRVLVTGDAFTSGEGLDPDEVWPHLLAESTDADVLNFGVTGYGPNQEAAVLSHYLPTYQPDVVVLQMFVNDFFDTMSTDDEFRTRIGFGRRSSTSPASYLSAQNLRAWLKAEVIGRFKGALDRRGWDLGNFGAIEAGAITAGMLDSVATRLEEMRLATEAAGARFVVVLIPGAAQMCTPQDLEYWPSGVEVDDPNRFDLDQPQTLMAEAAERAGVTEYFDLRPALTGSCYFQPANMHLIPEGQALVAAEVAAILDNQNR